MLKGFLLGIPQSLEDAAMVKWARTNCSRTSRSPGKTVTGAARKGMITSNRYPGFAMPQHGVIRLLSRCHLAPPSHSMNAMESRLSLP
jgi:hypothetical protein